MSHTLGFFALLLAFSRADALYGHIAIHCQVSSYEGPAVYLEQFYFNKILELQYNSSLGKVFGFTKKTKPIAEILNNNPRFMEHEKWKTELCKRNIHLGYHLLTPVTPTVKLKSVEAVGSRHPAMLVCSAYDFYPKQITVTWLRNGKEVTSDVMSTEELPNGNWFYQVHSYLEFTPRPGEKITCMVEHASLKEPDLYDWEPEFDSAMRKIIIGIAGVLLGLVFIAAGLIYYKKKTSTRVLVPTTEVLYPEHTL